MPAVADEVRAPLGSNSDPRSQKLSLWTSRKIVLAALGIMLLTIGTRAPSLFFPQPIDDEAVYSVVANAIVDGGQPYVDAVERKPPLLFWTYAAVFELAGEYNWKALHTVALLWTLATMAGLYVIGRRLFDPLTGLIAALFYSIFQCWATGNNLAFNGELMMNLPLVWAWAITLGNRSSRLRPELFVAGALLCAGFLLKQPAAIAAVPMGIYLLLPSYRASHGLTRADSLRQAGLLSAGFFGSLGLVVLALWRQGIFREAFYWTVTNHTVPYLFWENAALHTSGFAALCLPLLIGAALACRNKDHVWAGKRPERAALFYLTGVSIIGAAAGGRFYPHYYIQLIPPMALLAAPHYARIWSGTVQPSHWLLRPRVTCVWLAATVIAFSISHWRFFAPQRASSGTGTYLSEHSTPADRIFVWGKKPKIYLQARRRPACRYVEIFPLTGSVFGGPLPGLDTRNRIVPGSWANLEQDFAKHPPLLIADYHSDPGSPYPIRNFPVLAKLISEKYRKVARTADAMIYRMR